MTTPLLFREFEPEPERDWLHVASATASATAAGRLVVVHSDTQQGGGWSFYGDAVPTAPRWTIKNILPETGVALVAGQWGTFKTTVVLDIALSIMTGRTFADKYLVKRTGAVLYLPLEGEKTIRARLAALAAHKGITNELPFGWSGNCPSLASDKDATNKLCQIVAEAAVEVKKRFGMPVVMVCVDTLVLAAGYASAGEDNDTASTAKVWGALATLAKRINALVIGVDHFGKIVETGTKGSSNKEGSSDTVLALLADRELSGNIKNSRLAVRKQRDGISGFEIPFTAKIIETGTDEDGDPETAVVIDWQAMRPAEAKQGADKWPPSLRLLWRVLHTALADHGKEIRPFADGPLVRACDIEKVRDEFYRQYPADGDDAHKAETRKKAFKRAMNSAHTRQKICTRELNGTQFIWLFTAEDERQGTDVYGEA
jgi:hypothetical protein